MKDKAYSLAQVLDKFEKKNKSEKIGILWEALGEMQYYNGRSKLECIALAMGLEIYS